MDTVLASPPPHPEGNDSLHSPGFVGLVHDDEQFLARGLMSATARRPLTPNEKRAVRQSIARYCERCENAKASIHYSQARPMTHLGVPPERGFTADCSGHSTGCFYWAREKTGLPVEDPNGLSFNRTGYTGTLLAANRDRQVPFDRVFFVGDLALYGTWARTTHVVTCRKGGRAAEAVWTSHGSEAGPYAVRLRYRSDLLCVLRPWSLR